MTLLFATTFGRRLAMVNPRLRRSSLTLLFALSIGLGLSAPAWASGPIITDYAGTGTAGAPVAGPATSSPLHEPTGIALDSAGNLYIADQNNNEIEKVTPSGTLSIIAGDGSSGRPVAGPATESPLGQPEAVAVDAAGDVYIADTDNSLVEKVTPSGTLSIVAGNGTSGFSVPGPATGSPVQQPDGLAVDSAGNLYISAEGSREVDKVTPTGILSVFAGDGGGGSPTPGPATSSSVGDPAGLAVDAHGNLYIADYGNSYVDKVTPAGTLSVFAGSGGYGAPTPGSATSSQLPSPWGLGFDAAGNLYVTAEGGPPEVMITPGGALSIFAGEGGYGTPTYGGSALSSALNWSGGVAVYPDGTVLVSDSGNNTIDRIGPAAPGAPGRPSLTPGDTTAQLTFAPPIDPGSSPVTGYQISLDGGATWVTITTSPGPGGTLAATLNGLTDGTIYDVIVRAVNGSGPGAASPSGSVTPQVPAPRNTRPPAIAGAPAVGKPLTCSDGTWAGAARYTYQWSRDGAAIPHATASTYTPAAADQGHTLTCTVTAYSSGGSLAQSTSAGVLIPIVNASLCPEPTLALSGTQLGPIWLGMSRRTARQRLPRFEIYSAHTDNFCLAGGPGIRVGYETRQLLRELPGHPRVGGIILALTANPYYSLDGIRPGSPLHAAAARLALGRAIRWGSNRWYVIATRTVSWVLKVRHGIVEEIGIASRRVTDGRPDQIWLLATF